MRIVVVVGGVAVAALMALPPQAQAQQERAFVVGAYGGSAHHLVNLNTGTNVADFKTGYEIGGTAGFDLGRYVGIHADFTFTRNQARGASLFSGSDFNRYFYGVHLEARYPAGYGFSPYVFGGGGAVTIDQVDGTAVGVFTKPAGMFGLGMLYAVPRAPVDAFVEGKNFVYRWDRAGFDRSMVDMVLAGGLRYRIQF